MTGEHSETRTDLRRKSQNASTMKIVFEDFNYKQTNMPHLYYCSCCACPEIFLHRRLEAVPPFWEKQQFWFLVSAPHSGGDDLAVHPRLLPPRWPVLLSDIARKKRTRWYKCDQVASKQVYRSCFCDEAELDSKPDTRRFNVDSKDLLKHRSWTGWCTVPGLSLPKRFLAYSQ